MWQIHEGRYYYYLDFTVKNRAGEAKSFAQGRGGNRSWDLNPGDLPGLVRMPCWKRPDGGFYLLTKPQTNNLLCILWMSKTHFQKTTNLAEEWAMEVLVKEVKIKRLLCHCHTHTVSLTKHIRWYSYTAFNEKCIKASGNW